MSYIYSNKLYDEIQNDCFKDLTFSLVKLSIEKGIPINHNDIAELDAVLKLEKADQASSLKQIFINISKRSSQ